MRLLALLLTLLVTAGCSGCASIPSHDALRATALRLESPTGVCGGTATGPDTLITAQHCIDGLAQINGVPVKVARVDVLAYDVVRLTLNAPLFTRWAKTGPRPLEGQKVRWWGQAAGLEFVYREGYVARGWTTETLVDANGWFGDSGGGIFDDRGRLVAVLSSIKTAPHPKAGVFRLMVVVPVQ